MLIEHIYSDLYEAFAPAQKTGNKNVVDLRDPTVTKAWDGKRIRCHVFLTADDKAIVFNYGNGNLVEWGEVMDSLRNPHPDQPGRMGIVPYRNGYMLDIVRDAFSGDWDGHITKHSRDAKSLAAQLLKLGLATESTPLWVGRWAGGKALNYLSNVGKLLSAPELPRRLTIYHGTSNYRWAIIQEEGLNPVERAQRIWNRGSVKRQPAHRDDSVYLTASLNQAEYFAQKAAQKDMRQYGSTAARKAYILWDKANRIMHSERFQTMSEWEQSEVQRYSVDTERLAKWYQSGEPIKGVVLKISIPASQYNMFKADDDYLLGKPDADPDAWFDSLSEFAQVAFTGPIPPNRIKFLKNI